jgi:hypothetical protein
MHPVPTSIYNLLNPDVDPLLTVVVTNESREPRRVCVKAFIEGLSAQSVRTVEIEPRKNVTLPMLPTLLPDRAKAISEIQRATLHVIVEDLDGRPESYDTYSVVCLSRNSSFNAIRHPDTGAYVDLSKYYGAWVTPYDERVQQVIRNAADRLPTRQFWGYQGDQDSVNAQVRALFETLAAMGVAYINSVIDYGALPGQSTQRTRLPRESLELRSANCIDGTVLFASLLEGASLNAAIVIVPGHAFVGWETWNNSNEWHYLETTMIGTSHFVDACRSGERQFELAKQYRPERLVVHKLRALRCSGIWPIE